MLINVLRLACRRLLLSSKCKSLDCSSTILSISIKAVHRQYMIQAPVLLQKYTVAMEQNGIKPDVISCVPQHVLEVSFGDKKVDMGNVLTPTQVQNQPTHIKWPTEDGAFYTLIMTDPDAPSRAEPKFREWHHWIVCNISGCNVAGGDTVLDYVGSGPPPKTGLHRYVYLVYAQPGGKMSVSWPRIGLTGDGRGQQAAREFASKHSLGERPLAGNFYLAEYDDYVPELYKKLGAAA